MHMALVVDSFSLIVLSHIYLSLCVLLLVRHHPSRPVSYGRCTFYCTQFSLSLDSNECRYDFVLFNFQK